jgi:alpha-D-ribose 1-methylphosphonate 5-triphosphate synthase subunit PhnH
MEWGTRRYANTPTYKARRRQFTLSPAGQAWMAYLHTEAQMDALQAYVRGTQLACDHAETSVVDVPDVEDDAGRLIDGARLTMCNACAQVVRLS